MQTRHLIIASLITAIVIVVAFGVWVMTN